MQSNVDRELWSWPDKLDALTAATDHHRLLLENESVRVLDTCIPPGEMTAAHTHRFPAALCVLSSSDFIRYDQEGNVILDSRNLSQSPLPSTALWSDTVIPHAVKNVGPRDLHVISVEIKKQ
jgi:hypothetical protein